ncbi:hypothetical protein CYY_004647 [Polysphondylium violaceum]|uniref:Mitochondrial substrate carrier family protein n=1 Tax=Polysphondylium violaceum TaxID=133409 RepID=A0A8J4PUA6_9MYCE|nr:hypothetical protein CYY_004647 [Polysphondylium violaceum]
MDKFIADHNKWANISKDFIAGSVGGMSAIMAGHPFDTIKVMLQDGSGNMPKFNNGYQALKYTIKLDGVKGLYRGLSVPLVSVSFINSIFFATNNYFQNLFHPQIAQGELIPYHKAALAGGIAGGVISFFITPRDLVKTKLQIQIRPYGSTQINNYKGPIDVIRKTIQTKGFSGMFRGINSTFCRDIPGDAAYFMVYEFMKRFLLQFSTKHNSIDAESITTNNNNSTTRKHQPLPAWVAVGAGGTAGMSFWFSIYPMDVIKTRIQTQPEHLPPKYKGVIDCAIKIYREEGINTFFRGFLPTLLRSFPTSAVNFLMYETTKDLLHSKFASNDSNAGLGESQ